MYDVFHIPGFVFSKIKIATVPSIEEGVKILKTRNPGFEIMETEDDEHGAVDYLLFKGSEAVQYAIEPTA